ncbi:hypothetical protein PR048_030939 [Dryococelus australis]|uniref:Uncharacterized protein n=1 Tax=Dryococelus australis TaxID=614101 RepID=A0ABQ9GAA3_9NEOP|nr:hypothetical protein PR048_030939 [Dryococelus australis]
MLVEHYHTQPATAPPVTQSAACIYITGSRVDVVLSLCAVWRPTCRLRARSARWGGTLRNSCDYCYCSACSLEKCCKVCWGLPTTVHSPEQRIFNVLSIVAIKGHVIWVSGLPLGLSSGFYSSNMFNDFGAAVSERLACSTPTKANRIQSPAGSLPEFRMWKSCRTMPLVGGFSRGSPVFPELAFRPCSILTSFHLHRLSRPQWSGTGMQGRGEREIPRETPSTGTIPTCGNPGVTPRGTEPSLHRCEASRLTAQPPRPQHAGVVVPLTWAYTSAGCLHEALGRALCPIGYCVLRNASYWSDCSMASGADQRAARADDAISLASIQLQFALQAQSTGETYSHSQYICRHEHAMLKPNKQYGISGSRLPRPCNPELLHTYLASPSSALKTSMAMIILIADKEIKILHVRQLVFRLGSFKYLSSQGQVPPCLLHTDGCHRLHSPRIKTGMQGCPVCRLSDTWKIREFKDLQARLYSLMCRYPDVNCALDVCCLSGRRQLGLRSPGDLKHRTACLSPRQTRLDSRRGYPPNFRMWESCRAMPLVCGVFLGISRFPRFFNSGAVPYSNRFTLVRSQDLAAKNRPNLFTHSTDYCPIHAARNSDILKTWLDNIRVNRGISANTMHVCSVFALSQAALRARALTTPATSSSVDNRRTIAVFFEQLCLNSIDGGGRGGVVARIIAFHQRRTGLHYPRARFRIFTCGNRARKCRSSAGFRGGLPFTPPLHSGAALSALIGSQEHDVKSRPDLCTLVSQRHNRAGKWCRSKARRDEERRGCGLIAQSCVSKPTTCSTCGACAVGHHCLASIHAPPTLCCRPFLAQHNL